MIEAFKLVGRIAMEGGEKVEKSLSGIEKKLNEQGKKWNEAGKKTQAFGKKMLPVSAVATGAGVALFGLAKNAGDYADAILDARDQTGLSTDAIQEFEHITKIAGISSDSFTNMSRELTKQMTKLETGTGKGAEALDTLGIGFDELQKASPEERIDLITNALRGVDDPAERARLGTDLLKRSYDDIAPTLGFTAEEMDGLKQEAHDLGSVMGEDSLNEANNFRIEMEKLTTRFQNTGREIAMKFMPIFREHLLPMIENAIEFVGNLTDRFTNLSPTTIKIVTGIGALVAILAPAIMIIGFLISTVGSMIGVIRTVTTVVKLFNLTLLANPITWIVLGIMALIAVIVLLYKNWDQISAFLSESWAKLKEMASRVFGQVKDAIVNGFNKAKDGAIQKANELKDKVLNAITNAKENAIRRVTEIKDGIIKRFSEARDQAEKRFNELKKKILSPIEKAKETISGIVDDIKGFFTGMKLSIPKPKLPSLPSFKITGSLDLLNIPPRIPKLSVKWNERGSYFDRPTILQGLGENGKEVIMPTEHRRHMAPFARAVADNLSEYGGRSGGTMSIEVPIALNGREIARAVVKDIDRELERRRNVKQRGGRGS